MKTTARLFLVFAAPLLTAAPASAWHHHRMTMAPMPMMPMMPMMGMGVMPMPMLGLGGGAGLSMSLTMQGDMTMALLMPGLLRNLLGGALGTPAARMTEAEVAALAERFASALARSGGGPMTQAQAQVVIDLLNRFLRERGIDVPNANPNRRPATPPANPEMEQARAVVRGLVAEGAARRNVAATRDVERARADVQRLVAEGAARPNTARGASDLDQARAELRKLVAEGAARQTGRNRAAGTTVASGAK